MDHTQPLARLQRHCRSAFGHGHLRVVPGTYKLHDQAFDHWGDHGSQIRGSGRDNSELTTANPERTTRKAFTFTPRGKVQAKGKGEMEMYFVGYNVPTLQVV